MSAVTLPSPAKLNLFLHINGRRDDGYHDLQTLFQLLDYGDNLTFKANTTGKITLSPSLDGVDANDNLIIRAARLLQDKTSCKQGCAISLDKRIPMGGGLGGAAGGSNPLAPITSALSGGANPLAPITNALGGVTNAAGGSGSNPLSPLTGARWEASLLAGGHCSRIHVCERPIRLMPMKPRTVSLLPVSSSDILAL